MAQDAVRLMQSLFLQVAESFQEVTWHPAADVYRTPTGWLVKLDLAGVRPEEIAVHVCGSRLTVRGIRRDWARDPGCNCVQMEITYSHFERSLELPSDLERAAIATEYRDGMLLVRIHMGGAQ